MFLLMIHCSNKTNINFMGTIFFFLFIFLNVLASTLTLPYSESFYSYLISCYFYILSVFVAVFIIIIIKLTFPLCFLCPFSFCACRLFAESHIELQFLYKRTLKFEV